MKEQLYKGYPIPKTNEQEVLLTLIIYGNTSFFDFPYLQGYRTRVSQLQTLHKLSLDHELKTQTNKFGRTYSYAVHRLPESEKEKAVALYYKINKGEA